MRAVLRENFEHQPTLEESKRYLDQIYAEVASFLPPPPQMLWHYTSGDGLMGILGEGSLWSTHVSCLNDTGELNYAHGLLLDALREQAEAAVPGSIEDTFLSHVLSNSSRDGAGSSDVFVACLTEKGDDLSQWRSYAGGEGGYAVGFNAHWILQGVDKAFRKGIYRVNYKGEDHRQLARRLAVSTVTNYLAGRSARQHLPESQWMQSFLTHWSASLTQLGPAIKHPAFADEAEWRFVHRLLPTDIPHLRYRQRRSMMARHLPLRLPATGHADTNYLPITHIRVGPSPHREVSAQSIRHLLATLGYQHSVSVETSAIPFQAL
jgi:hypothetical protein